MDTIINFLVTAGTAWFIIVAVVTVVVFGMVVYMFFKVMKDN
jgi:uncharacterized membrane protein